MPETALADNPPNITDVTSPRGDNRKAALDGLAFEARRSYRKSHEEWLTAAAAVAEAKGLCEHGEFGPWLAKTGISTSTAHRMVILDEAGVQISHMGNFGVRRLAELTPHIPAGLIEAEGLTEALYRTHFMLKAQAICRHMADAKATTKTERGAILQAWPDSMVSALTWIEWGGEGCEAAMAKHNAGDPDALLAWHDRAPWKLGNLHGDLADWLDRPAAA